MLLASNEKGQGLVEYAFILVFVAIITIAAITYLGPAIGNVFTNVIQQL